MIECAFTGRLGRDAELRRVKNGSLPMLAFSAAVEDGQAADDAQPAQWIRCVLFGETAEQLALRLLKGVKVYVEGKLRLDTFEGRDGQTRSGLNVTASAVQPIGQIVGAGRGRRNSGETRHERDNPTASRRQLSARGVIAISTSTSSPTASTVAGPTRFRGDEDHHDHHRHHRHCRADVRSRDDRGDDE